MSQGHAEQLQRIVDAGGILSILVGAWSWFGANLPFLLQLVSFIGGVCAIVRYGYLFYRWWRRG